ncbi:cyclophilin-like fold protein [Cytobacillus pseudoceanisediminis]
MNDDRFKHNNRRQVFSAKLYYNQTTQAFIKKLPLDINMSDVN